MIRFTVHGWRWHAKSRDVLEPWFVERERLMESARVKSNPNRTVFRAAGKGMANYFVKFDHPKSTFHKIRALLASKVASEFNVLRDLRRRGVAAVEPVAYGWKGPMGMLVTLEEPDSRNAREFWQEVSCISEVAKNLFLDAALRFTRDFLASGARHPDLHLGNLLAARRRGGLSLVMVDPYGLKLDDPPEDPRDTGVWTLLASFRGRVTYDEGAKFLRDAGLAKKIGRARDLWREIVRFEAEANHHDWTRRKLRILSGNSRFTSFFEDEHGGFWFVRNLQNGKPLLPEAQLRHPEELNEHFNIQELEPEEAERDWLKSFQLQFHQIDHRRPLAWHITKSNQNFLFHERFAEAEIPSAGDLADFLDRCGDSGVSVRKPKKNVLFVNGAMTVVDLDVVELDP